MDNRKREESIDHRDHRERKRKRYRPGFSPHKSIIAMISALVFFCVTTTEVLEGLPPFLSLKSLKKEKKRGGDEDLPQ